VSKKDTFIVRQGRAGATSSVTTTTLPGGQRVHTLDRGVFERAVRSAETTIVGGRAQRDAPAVVQRPKHERT
jgi:hypothetical protein